MMAITIETDAARRWRSGWRPSVWLFDFDGTLVDSVELILDSYRYATATVLGRTPPDETLRRLIGRPLLEAMSEIDVEHAEELVDVYRVHNMPRHADLLASYPGVDELLAALVADQRTIGIVTSKRLDAVELGLGLLQIDAPFATTVTWESTTRHKPLPDPVLEGLRSLGADAADAIYVGDTAWDIQAGRAAGVTTAAVLWGVGSREELLAEEPDLVFASPAEVLAG
jgi:pyrophosphatase PpaX